MLVVKGMRNLKRHEVIPTPSVGINYLLNGGLWTGRFHFLWGNPGCGKSTFALHTMREAHAMGYEPILVDAEGTMTEEWVEKCGVDLDAITLAAGTEVEEILKVVLPAMRKKGEKKFILIDSINAIQQTNYYKNDDGGAGMASGARSQGLLMQKMAHELVHNPDVIVMIIVQQTMDLSGTYAMMVPKLSNNSKHWASNIIRLAASNAKDSVVRDKSSNRILNREVGWTINKSKQGALEGTKGSYWFEPESASIDVDREIMELAISNGLITQGGPWFTVKATGEKVQGKEKLYDSLCGSMVLETIKEELMGSNLNFEVTEEVVID